MPRNVPRSAGDIDLLEDILGRDDALILVAVGRAGDKQRRPWLRAAGDQRREDQRLPIRQHIDDQVQAPLAAHWQVGQAKMRDQDTLSVV